MQEADVGTTRSDGFAVDFEHQAEHAVGGGMLRSHVEDHGAVLVALFHARFDQRCNGEVCGVH